MQANITKLCADSLRAFTIEKYGIKLKPSHAHQLVAAFFGYPSQNAMLADTKYPLRNLRQASIIVLNPTAPIDQRRKDLQGLSPDLPDTYTLAEGAYISLINEKMILRNLWPTYELLAAHLADDYLRQQRKEKIYRAPVREGIKIEHEDDFARLTIFRFYQIPLDNGPPVYETNVITTIRLPRIAAHIGYANPEISVKTEELGVRA